jgi:hypothetical protein
VPCVILLDGFVYERFAGRAPTDAVTRRKWLLRQPLDPARFRPQPFEQLIGVLRRMGHEQDARVIGLLKESLLHPVRVRRASFWARPLVALTGYAWGTFCGYGYRPHRLFVLLVVLWLACTFFFKIAEENGAFAPADPQIWTNRDVLNRCATVRWTICDDVVQFMPFNAAIYSADVIFRSSISSSNRIGRRQSAH